MGERDSIEPVDEAEPVDESTDDEPASTTTATTISKQVTKGAGKAKNTPPSATAKDTKDSKKKASKKKGRGRRQDDDYDSDDDDKLSALEGLLGQLGASSDRDRDRKKSSTTKGTATSTGTTISTGAASESKGKSGGKKASGKTTTTNTSTTLNKAINTNTSVLYDTYFPTNNTESRTAIHQKIANLLDKKVLITINDIDVYEWKGLSLFPDEDITAILTLFEEGCGQRKVGNKSGFLAGIMKRYRSDVVDRKLAAVAAAITTATTTTTATKESAADDTKEPITATPSNNDSIESPVADTDKGKGNGSSEDEDQSVAALDTDLNKGEEEEEEEGEGDHEEEGEEEEVDESIDELDIFTGTPFPDDIILYALPVCGPYSTLMRYKYRVKLSPGIGKKGKICKQAIDIFTESRDCTSMERNALKGLTDTEMVANMIGDCKLSIPGLTKVIQQTQKRKVQRGQKKKQ